jgi:DNA-directed RNA polymerase alpha subunit
MIMITKYRAIALNRGRTVTGYAVRIDGQYYIYQEDGKRILVEVTSIVPISDDQEEQWEGYPKDKHPLCCLGLSEYIINNIGFSGVKYLEELESWTDTDYDRVRGIGPAKKRQIKEVLEKYHIKFNGTI